MIMVWMFLTICIFITMFWCLMFNGVKPNRDIFGFYSFWETFFGSAGFAIMFFLVGILVAFILSAIWEDAPVEIITSTDHEIVALQDNLELKGSFFLGSGYVDNELSYAYMRYVDGCGYKIETVDASNAYVEFTDKQPYVSIVSYQFKDKWRNYFTVPYNSGDAFFYVPEGSILQNYNIDLKQREDICLLRYW